MNAVIEAAYAGDAGDAGKGYAVVTDEIRKLAEETNNNSRLIREKIETNERYHTPGQARVIKPCFPCAHSGMNKFTPLISLGNNEQVQKSVTATDELRDIFEDVGKNISQVRLVMEETIAVMQELSAGTDSITGSMTHLLTAERNVFTALDTMKSSVSSGNNSI